MLCSDLNPLITRTVTLQGPKSCPCITCISMNILQLVSTLY